MAKSFWEAQRQARLKTTVWVSVFILMTVGMALLLEVAITFYLRETKQPQIPYLGFLFLIITLSVAGIYYLIYKSQGGDFVAKQLGAVEVDRGHSHFKVQQFCNIVDEMAIAASLPQPKVYVLKCEQINAFAAGTKPQNAAITVTTGALEKLNREELQGVVAHEFGHIASQDMLLNMRLAAMIMGFFIVFYLGIRLMQVSVLTGGRRGQGASFGLIAMALLIAGAVTWFLGAILRSTVSRQREYLADASSVQFTRNPKGLANALAKIAQEGKEQMPKTGMGYAHLYFSHRSVFGKLFATHPPIEKRIEAILGHPYSSGESSTP